MKKNRMLIIVGLVVVIALSLGVGLVAAQYGEPGPHADSAGFVDEDGDGVCDHAGTGNFIDEDGDGVCDHAGTGLGAGLQGRRGNREWNRSQDGTGSGFIDSDGDGICDNRE